MFVEINGKIKKKGAVIFWAALCAGGYGRGEEKRIVGEKKRFVYIRRQEMNSCLLKKL